MAELSTFRLHPGDPAPEFSLPATDGRTVRLDDFADARLLGVVWWCNHCPYVRAWEDRLVRLAEATKAEGVAFVAINANDAEAYPDDRMELMIRRASERHYPFPYLRDDSQQVARAYGALVTPHPMLFDARRRLVYQGPIDDDYERPDRVGARYLEEAVRSALAGRPVAPAERPVRGCSVKWRS